MEETNNSTSQTRQGMVLRTEGLVKRYGKRTVANGVTINVRQGEIVGLLGPNGAGKTTSFYMTTGLVIPNAGHVYLNDEDINAKVREYLTTERPLHRFTDLSYYETVSVVPTDDVESLKLALCYIWLALGVHVDWSRPVEG